MKLQIIAEASEALDGNPNRIPEDRVVVAEVDGYVQLTYDALTHEGQGYAHYDVVADGWRIDQGPHVGKVCSDIVIGPVPA